MKPVKIILISSVIIAISGMYACKSEEVLTGEIRGSVTEAQTSLPLQSAKILLMPANDSVNTTSDGKFLFTNVEPGNYDVQASKQAYERKTVSAIVAPSKTTEINFSLDAAPVPLISEKNLDFGIDPTEKRFTLSNSGKVAYKYTIIANEPWIAVNPSSGEIFDGTDTVSVTINRTGLPGYIQQGSIEIRFVFGEEGSHETVKVWVNGVMDRDLRYYSIVKIGAQVWMAENLNTGTMIAGGTEQTDYQNIKKYCYDNDDSKCSVYGGLYQWPEMMLGAQPDNASTGTTRGVCPVGWHIPTLGEWNELISYLGETVAGIKLKEPGTTHWLSPNAGTNESGFTALPGGIWDSGFALLKSHELFWTASSGQSNGLKSIEQLEYTSERVIYQEYQDKTAAAVRCIKDN